MYPNPYGNQPGLPPSQPGFQPPPYPSSQQGPGYPPPAYPQQAYPQQNQGAPYPPQPQQGFGGYNQPPAPYPATGFPNQPGGIPPYPPQQGGIGFPSQGSIYPPNQPSGIPGLPQGYPPQQQQGGFPSQYPPQQQQQQPPAYGSGPGYRAPEYPIAPTSGYSTASAPGYPTSPNLSGGGNYQQPLSGGFPSQGGHSNPSASFGSSAPAYPVSPSHAHAHAPLHAHQQQPHYQQQSARMEVPTIKNVPNDSTADAQVLRKAMKGFGTDEAAIIGVLAKRTNAQRLDIAKAYKTSFGKDLIKDLKSELGGRLEQVVLAMMTPLYDYLAETVHKAMSGLGTKEKILVDVLCTATNQEIANINASYQKLYHTTLERDLQGDTSGSFERLLVSMSTGGRNENPVVDAAIAAQDADNLYQAGEKKWGTDESAFNAVLATRSYPQLRAMFEEYEKKTGHPFEKAIQKEFSGDIQKGMLAVVKVARNRAAYFAERIHDSVAGLGTKDDDLIFLIVTRSEIDLETVKQEYQRLYNKSLANDVGGDTGGDYKKILLALAGN